MAVELPLFSHYGLAATLRERIFAFAASRYMGGSAEDLAQDVLLVLHEKYQGVESLEELESKLESMA